MDVGTRVECAERQLALVQSFFGRVDTRMTALFAILTGQAAVLVLNLHTADFRNAYAIGPAILFTAIAIVALQGLYRCAYPDLKGGERSLVYFAEIAKLREAEYVKAYTKITDQALLDDLTAQIWRNSKILAAKYTALKRATIAVGLGTAPWLWTLGKLAYDYGRMPTVGGS